MKVITRKELEKDLKFDVPEISWGDEFNLLDPERKVIYLKKLTSSLNWALKDMQDNRNKLAGETIRLNKQIKNLETNLGTQKTLLSNMILERNDQEQKYLERIRLLEAKVRENNGN